MENTVTAPPRAAPTLWQVLTAAPHRLLFLPGAVQIVAVLAWWLLELAARAGGFAPPAPRLPVVWTHSFLMIYGVFPFFIFGFLFTVYPRWLGGVPVARRAYVPAFLLLASGQLLFYVALYAPPVVAAVALGLVIGGWIVALAALLRVYAHARQRGPHERLLNLALGAGVVGIGAFLGAVVTGPAWLFAVAREFGLWLFLVPVVFLVAHRMIPFFSQGTLMNYVVVRPAWAPPLMLVCVAAHAAFDLAGLEAWRFLADLPLAVAALHLSWAWQFRRSFHARLLAMLHIAFLWLGIAMLLFTLQSLALLVTGSDPIGRAALHALGIGFFTSMIVAMASRVMLGHSGRMLAADTLTWATLLGVNLAALLRIAGEWWPTGDWLNLLAGLVWLAALTPWAVRHLPMVLKPRVDGQPG